MVDLISRTISQDGKSHLIMKFEVWWRTPFGLHTNLTEATARLQDNDMPVTLALAIPVAVAEDTYEELR